MPGTSDSMESTEQARARAAQASVIGAQTPTAQQGVQAARTLDEVRNGIETRNMRLSSANRQVQRLETRLGEQLQNVAPSLTQEQRQQYADAYRQRNQGAYDEARTAARDLATYTRDNLPRVEQATRDLAGHPMAGAVHDLPARTTMAMQESVRQLDQAVRQSPTGDPQLSQTLGELGTRFQDVASRAQEPSNGTNIRPALGGTGIALNQLSQDVQSLARRASGAFGAAAGTLGAIDNAGRILDGSGRAEHYVGGAANVAQVAGGVLRVAGVAIGGPISMAAGGVALVAGGVSAYRDRQQYVGDVTSTLQATGMDASRADAIARSNPEALRRLQTGGFTPEQIQQIASSAPNTLRVHQDQAGALAQAAQRFNLSPEQVTNIVGQLGAGRADPGIDALSRALSVSRDQGNDAVLRDLRQGWGANAVSRQLADLLSAH